jgi:hypothetical protein
MAATEVTQQNLRITQAAIKSLFTPFDKHRWEKLPNEKELLGLQDVQAIIMQHSLSIDGVRVKIVRQFKNWSDTINSAGSESLPKD